MSPQDNWLEEKQSAWLYRRIAAVEPEPRMRQLFESLAAAAESQALRWQSLAPGQPSSGRHAPSQPTSSPPSQLTAPFAPSLRARLVAALAGVFGPRHVRPMLAAMKIRGLSAYDSPAPTQHAMPMNVEDVGRRHKVRGGGNLRAAVFGINDGLVSNTSLLMGVAGAAAGPHMLITGGVAGLLAGALSMAAGEYISIRSQREMFEYQIALEREELDEYPDAEAEELALIYEARGVPLEAARDFSRTLMADPQRALDALAREELGLNPNELGSPWGAAITSFLAFAVGAAVPLLPFLFSWGQRPLMSAAVLAAVSLFGVGSALSLFSGRSALWGGLRMLTVGAGAALVTYSIGHLLATGH